MNKLVIKRIPIENKEQQELDIDIDQIKNELQDSIKDHVVEHVTYSINENYIVLLFVMRQYTSKGIGFKTGNL